MANFFTSDTHFSDINSTKDCGIIYRDNRPFENVEEMDKYIIDTWNSQASKEDIIYHLGDFFNYNKKDHISYEKGLSKVKEINAKVILILGNQETRLMADKFDNDFKKFKEYLLSFGFYDVIEEGLILNMRGKDFYLNHYPSKYKKNYFNLFGHIHSLCMIKKFGMNVGVDCMYFKLFSEDTIFRYISEYEKFYDINVFC